MKVKTEIIGPIYVMGVMGQILPKFRIKDGNLVWDKLYSSLKKKYPNFKRNENGELVLWGVTTDIKKGFAPLTSNDYLVNYFCGVEVFNEAYFPPFETIRIPEIKCFSVELTDKQFKLEYSKIVKEMKKYIDKKDYNLIGPIQEKYENGKIYLYFPVELLG